MKNVYKNLVIILVTVFAAGALIFVLSGVVEAFDEFEIEEEPAVEEEPAREHDPYMEEEPSAGEEDVDPWMREEEVEEPKLTTRQIAVNSCKDLPAPGEVNDELKPLMKVEISNLALNLEREFFERPDECNDILEEWFED